MKPTKHLVVFIILQIFLVKLSFSQTLLLENFEGSFPTPGWVFQGANGQGWSQNTTSFNAVSGTKSLRSYCPSFLEANAWAFLPALNLSTGVLYRISYWYRGSSSGGYTERFKLTMGTGNTVNDQNTIVHNFPSVTNTSYLQGVDTISVPVAGNYNFAFNYYSSAGQAVIYLDSIVVKELIPTPCANNPSIGVATAPAMVAADSSFKLSLSGNYQLISGLQFQWQRSMEGANNFQDISGANSPVFSTQQNNNGDYRCMVTCMNSGSTVTSNIVNVAVAGLGSSFRNKYVGSTSGTNAINGVSFLSPSTGYAAFSSSIGYTQDSGQTYNARPITIANTNFNGYPVNLTFGFSCNGLHALSIDTLVVFGDYGAEPAILFSSNGGLNWKVVFHQPFNGDIGNGILDLEFPSPTLGVAISQKYIMESTNRGEVWSVKLQIGGSATSIFSSISMPSVTRGYIAAGNYIYRRLSGFWNPVSATGIPNNTGLQFNRIGFASDFVGYVLRDDENSIYKTTNGGVNWTRMNDPQVSEIAASDLHFINDSTGFASGLNAYQVLKTSNSGRTWELCKRNSDYQFAFYGLKKLFFLNKNIGWACGTGEFLMMTTTAGNPTLPKAFFSVDTTNLTSTGLVKLNSFSHTYYSHKWFKNGLLVSTSFDGSYTHNIYNTRDTIQLIVSNGTDSDTLIKYQDFHPYNQLPVINTFSPASGTANTEVGITGIGFNATSSVKFGGIAAKSFTVHSNTFITAIVGGGSSGDIQVTTPSGTGTANGFVYLSQPAPIISSISPGNGAIGTTVFITGNHFGVGVDSNAVYFGNIRASLLSADTGEIICQVPPGASFGSISVTNLSRNLSAFSPTGFNVSFANNAVVNQSSFYNPLNIPAQNVNAASIEKYPLHASIGDVNQDGKNDIVCTVSTGWNNDSVYVLRNKSLSNQIDFHAFKVLTRGTKPCMGDFDNDGKIDIVFLHNNQVGILRNKGNLSFAPPAFFQSANGIQQSVINDLDSDGRPDILNVGYNESKLSVLRNVTADTSISFANKIEFSIGGQGGWALACGDLDGDNKPDVVVGASTTISVFRNTCLPEQISFAPKLDLSTTGNVSRIYIADVDKDNKPDIVTVYGTTTIAFSVFKNTSVNGMISFAPKIDFSASGFDYSETADINNFFGGDIPDLLTGNGNYYTSYFHRNVSTANGPITFSIPVSAATGTTGDLKSGDFDGDGKPDFLSLDDNLTVRTFHVFRNRVGENIEGLFCAQQASAGTFTSNINGSTYQWQVDDGTGFTNITNNTIYTGANLATLRLTSPPTSWNAFKYRCMVNGAMYSYTFELKFQNKWLGTVSNAWEDPGNWSCGQIPDQYTEVLIPSGNVVLSSNAVVGSMFVGSEVNFNIIPSFNLTITNR